MVEQIIETTTPSHTIEIVNGHLTIRGEQETLTPDEVEQLLDALLIWQYGLEELSVDDVESLAIYRLSTAEHVGSLICTIN